MYAHGIMGVHVMPQKPEGMASGKPLLQGCSDTKIGKIGKLLICSIYWDRRIDSFPPEAEAAMKLAREKDYTIMWRHECKERHLWQFDY